MTDSFNQFYTAETELNLKYKNEIHIHKQLRNGKKCNIIIQGLNFSTKQENKDFILKIKSKFGVGGCQKTMEEIDKINPVFVFMGDIRDKIRDLLIKDYGKEDEFIIYHG